MIPRQGPCLPLHRSEHMPVAGASRRAPVTTPPSGTAPRRKAFVRRAPGNAQLIRRSVQAAFLLLNLWIGARFYAFVRHYETGGEWPWVARPPGVEGWLPIAALMNLKSAVLTWQLPATHAAGLFLLVAFLAMALLLRKAFCSWLCPVGTVSEWLWEGGEAMFGRTLRVPHLVDVPLRGLKYVLLGLFLYAVASMPPLAIRAFLDSPYGVIADVKMLNFFRHLGSVGATVIGVLVLLSLVVQNAWCRYLCPYGAMLGLLALVSPVRIRRNPDACIDCGKCAAVCPAVLPVDRQLVVRSAECAACMLCVTACPAAGALDLNLGRRRTIPPWALATALGLLFVGIVGYARVTDRWHTRVPDAVYFELIPRAGEFSHP